MTSTDQGIRECFDAQKDNSICCCQGELRTILENTSTGEKIDSRKVLKDAWCDGEKCEYYCDWHLYLITEPNAKLVLKELYASLSSDDDIVKSKDFHRIDGRGNGGSQICMSFKTMKETTIGGEKIHFRSIGIEYEMYMKEYNIFAHIEEGHQEIRTLRLTENKHEVKTEIMKWLGRG